MAPSHPFPKGCYYALLLAACLVTMLGSLGFDDRTVLSYSPPFHQALNDMFGDSQAVSTVTSPPAQTAGLGGMAPSHPHPFPNPPASSAPFAGHH